MEDEIRRFFERYERLFDEALHGRVAETEVAALYAPEFIAATPAGVMAGKNDETFTGAMEQGYAHYRAIGTKGMRIRDVRVTPLDEFHCVAHVAWRATYARGGEPDVQIDFEVHYLVQKLRDAPKVFGWVSGDEQAVLEAHGIV